MAGSGWSGLVPVLLVPLNDREYLEEYEFRERRAWLAMAMVVAIAIVDYDDYLAPVSSPLSRLVKKFEGCMGSAITVVDYAGMRYSVNFCTRIFMQTWSSRLIYCVSGQGSGGTVAARTLACIPQIRQSATSLVYYC